MSSKPAKAQCKYWLQKKEKTKKQRFESAWVTFPPTLDEMFTPV